MHPILATGIVSLGRALVDKACTAVANGPQASFQSKLTTSPTNTTGSLAIHKSALERQILQHPESLRHGLQGPSTEPFCVKHNPDNTYTLSQGDKTITLSPEQSPLGTLLRNYCKTCEHLQNPQALSKTTPNGEGFSFYAA